MKRPEFLHNPDLFEAGMSAGIGYVVAETGLAVVGTKAGFNLAKSIPTRIEISNLNGDIDQRQNAQDSLTNLHVPVRLRQGTDKFLSSEIQDYRQQIAVKTDSLPNNPGISEWGPDVLGVSLAAAAFTFVALRTAMLSPRFRNRLA